MKQKSGIRKLIRQFYNNAAMNIRKGWPPNPVPRRR
jgi:hypothetical protein